MDNYEIKGLSMYEFKTAFEETMMLNLDKRYCTFIAHNDEAIIDNRPIGVIQIAGRAAADFNKWYTDRINNDFTRDLQHTTISITDLDDNSCLRVIANRSTLVFLNNDLVCCIFDKDHK